MEKETIQNTEQTQNQEPQLKVKKEKKANPVDPATYEKYTSLKFMHLLGAKLKDDALSEMKSLEEELKKCSGRIPRKTVRAAINAEQALIVSGVPVPEHIVKLIASKGAEDYYFEK